ncbi:MAG: PBP1A family penicillin-binding protein [Byssovorax sp.]
MPSAPPPARPPRPTPEAGAAEPSRAAERSAAAEPLDRTPRSPAFDRLDDLDDTEREAERDVDQDVDRDDDREDDRDLDHARDWDPPEVASEPPPPAGDAKVTKAAAQVAPKKKSRVLTWMKRVAVTLLVLALAAGVAGFLVLRHYEADLPSAKALKSYNPLQVTRVLARDGQLLGEIFVERRTLVPIETIPSQMKLAALAAEDASFYEHDGLNYLGLLRAIYVNVRGGRARQGGSTITQQVIKNVLLTPERTVDRKVREMILARQIESELSKDEILELYLNHIYFGHGRYGVEEAARLYFGKSVKEVTLAEAALLAGIIKGPEIFSPRASMAKALERRTYVLDQMVQKGFARPDQAEQAKKEPVVLAPEPEVLAELAPEVVDEVKRTLRTLVGPAADRGGYTVTTTIDPALQAAARGAVQRNADDYEKRHKLLAPLALAKGKKEPAPFEGTPSGRHAFLGVVTGADDVKNQLEVRVGTITGTVDLSEASRYNPKHLPASKFAEIGKVVRVSLVSTPADKSKGEPGASASAPPGASASNAPPATSAAIEKESKEPKDTRPRLRLELGPEGALVAIDVRSREILALVGNYEATRGGLDRATNAHRQPGSTFKAFVYSYAIHSRAVTPASIVETNPAALGGYKPDNYDEGEGKAPKRLRDAVAQSVNVAAVWTLEKAGASNVVAWAHSLGIESKLGADLSLALGAYEVSPREMAGAYATFAAGGVYEAPVLIKKIVGPNGAEVPLPARPEPRRVMDEAEAYVTTSLLTSVVQDGTGKRARALGRPIAGKTGTSNQAKDAWFVGYSTEIACAVWTGYDDPLPLGAGEAGASAALPAFVDFMREAHKKRPPSDFPVPGGVVRRSIDPASGLAAYPDQKDAIDEVFLAGTEPTEVAVPDAGAEGGEDGGDGDGGPGDAPKAADAGAARPAEAPGQAPPF